MASLVDILARRDTRLLQELRRVAQSALPHPDLFLCHSGKDKEKVKRLAKDLDRLGVRPWFDAWEIGPGDSLLDKIGEGINSSAYFGVLLSEHSVSSNWCRTELREALYKETTTGKIKIIPIKYDDVEVPNFIRSKLSVSLSTKYYEGLLRIASVVFGIAPKDVSVYLDDNTPKTVDDVLDFVLKQTIDNRVVMAQKDWLALQELFLRKFDFAISDQFDVINRRTGEKLQLF